MMGMWDGRWEESWRGFGKQEEGERGRKDGLRREGGSSTRRSHARSHCPANSGLHCSASASEVDGGVPAKKCASASTVCKSASPDRVGEPGSVALSHLPCNSPRSPGLLSSLRRRTSVQSPRFSIQIPPTPATKPQVPNIRNFADSRFGLARLIEGDRRYRVRQACLPLPPSRGALYK